MTAAALLQSRAPLFTAERAAAINDATARRAWVRVFYGDEATGAVDPCAVDTWGQLGWGWTPDESAIVGIMGEARRWLWRHPAFDLGRLELRVRPLREEERTGKGVGKNEYAILHDGRRLDAFRNLSAANRRLAYLTGRRFAP